MKRILAALFLTCALLTVPACSTANKTAYKTTQAVSATADIGLRVWADYITQQKLAGNPVSLEKELQVKTYWNYFQTARELVIKAGIAYTHTKEAGGDVSQAELELNAALSALTNAQADFLLLLQSLGVKL